MVVQCLCQCVVIYVFDLWVGQDGVGVQFYLCVDMGGYQFVVIGEDFDFYVMCSQCLQCLCS